MLAEYNFQIVYKKGSLNAVPDALSRRPDYELALLTTTGQVSQATFSIPGISKATYLADKYFASIYEQASQLDENDPLNWYGYVVSEQGLLYLREGQRLCVPDVPEAKSLILKWYHDDPTAGHQGVERTYQLVREILYWPGMYQTVKRYVDSCHVCATHKDRTTAANGRLQPLPIPGRPWEAISMDLITQLPKTKLGHDAIVVFVDRFSKQAVFVACKTKITAPELATLFFQNVFRYHGVPRSIVSDRDSRFTSAFWTALFDLMNTSLNLSTAYHQQTDGQTERTNRTLEQYLRMYTSDDQDDWDKYLVEAEFAYNHAKSSATGLSPFEVLYGVNPNVPASLLREPKLTTSPPSVQELLTGHWTRIQAVQDQLLTAQKNMADQYNKRRRDVSFQVDDLVYLDATNLSIPPDDPSRRRQRKNKLHPTYLGPFKILERPSALNYRLALHPDSKVHPVFHVSLLKPVVLRDPVEFPGGTPVDSLPLPLEDNSDQLYEGEWEVEAIRAHRNRRGKPPLFRVKWIGYPEEKNTWEPEEHLANASELLIEYKTKNGL